MSIKNSQLGSERPLRKRSRRSDCEWNSIMPNTSISYSVSSASVWHTRQLNARNRQVTKRSTVVDRFDVLYYARLIMHLKARKVPWGRRQHAAIACSYASGGDDEWANLVSRSSAARAVLLFSLRLSSSVCMRSSSPFTSLNPNRLAYQKNKWQELQRFITE